MKTHLLAATLLASVSACKHAAPVDGASTKDAVVLVKDQVKLFFNREGKDVACVADCTAELQKHLTDHTVIKSSQSAYCVQTAHCAPKPVFYNEWTALGLDQVAV